MSLPPFPLVTPGDLSSFRVRLGESASYVQARLPKGFAPRALVTLGTGLGELVAGIDDAVEVSYADVPHMRTSTASGHAGRFVAGTVAGVPVLCMQGRLHPYEGYSPLDVTYPVRIARHLGVDFFITTNATGGINAGYHPGQVVNICDHINFTGTNPLVGINDPEGPRCPDMTRAYSPRLGRLAHEVAVELEYDLYDGVYLGLSGPSFETPAEIRAFRTMGADLVGMSTVWEVIVAAHLGLETLGLSMVTNMAAGMLDEPISTNEINRAAEAGSHDMHALVRGVIGGLGRLE